MRVEKIVKGSSGKKEMAKKLKEKGSDISFIAEVSGLTPDEIEKL
jgi:hypothetical protein